jgi:hypothetical protein
MCFFDKLVLVVSFHPIRLIVGAGLVFTGFELAVSKIVGKSEPGHARLAPLINHQVVVGVVAADIIGALVENVAHREFNIGFFIAERMTYPGIS